MSQSGDNNTGGAPAPSDGPSTPGLTPLVVGMDAVGALIVLGMMIIVNIDVFGRWLADSPLAGTLELTEMGIVAVVYLQLAHTIRVKRLTRSDTFLHFLARRYGDRVDQALRMLFNLAGALMLAIIAYGQFPRLIDAWSRGYYKGNVGIFTAPTWPLEAIMLLGAAAASLQFLVLAWRNARAVRSA
ncbi:TRAP transporter small permease [Aestuariicoccus sp. MJ-SS9]|uniref:TRAP transporter small permease subunit n=1 Tax=Aestuariicoccus sp. MJ-SS9 TaxID=3079855 RepID=UPI002912A56D|nr:TRAP transporter small permease [Aestuariicoccus sp. MJ-SS9]MDU8913750.1 TRAP transporter small permease [Aestuariicoccus sp. MJ-SS9]